ncbi:MAG: methyltransferase domain-containing protein [Candidatus Aenigmarchaeota archaeon]|nr:methyltransferase domain-containing protein [Candidatus Aenigmarchaeota archaeon]
MKLKQKLKSIVPECLFDFIPNSFDILGSGERAIIIIDLPSELKKYKKQVAEALLELYKNAVCILNRTHSREGMFRNYKYEILTGSNDTEVIHKEHGLRFLVDPRKAYFSCRESTERSRLQQLVKTTDNVMVFFAGIGPIPVYLAKKCRRVVGIETNPKAVEYFKENIRLNKLNNVEAVSGDVRVKIEKFSGKFDRVFMPLPHEALNYLDEAVSCLKHRGIIHIYFFSGEDELKEKQKEIRKLIRGKVSFRKPQKVLPWGPGIYKYRLDIEVEKS